MPRRNPQTLYHVATLGDIYSDFTITLDPDSHRVHRLILHGRSQWFTNNFHRRPDSHHANLNNLNDAWDITPNTLKSMLDFFYTDRYDVPYNESNKPFHYHIKMFRMGLDFEARSLVDHAVMRFSVLLKEGYYFDKEYLIGVAEFLSEDERPVEGHEVMRARLIRAIHDKGATERTFGWWSGYGRESPVRSLADDLSVTPRGSPARSLVDDLDGAPWRTPPPRCDFDPYDF